MTEFTHKLSEPQNICIMQYHGQHYRT